MDKVKITEEIRKLSDLLYLYQDAYYLKNNPIVSDLEYDRVFDRLVTLEKENPDLILPDSPTLRVGSDLLHDIPEVAHSIPVLSLDKGYSVESIRNWMEKTITKAESRLSFVVEEKIDGVSIVLYYKKGVLDLAVTRGNGAVGNDITSNVKTIKSVPLRLREAVDIAVRGEIFLPIKEFQRLNDKMEIPYANPRNLTAGTLRRKKSSDVAAVPLDIFIYEGFSDGSRMDHTEILIYLRRLGFRVSSRIGCFASSKSSWTDKSIDQSWFTGDFGSLAGYIERSTAERDKLAYEIDGLVIKVNETDVRDALGFTGHHPRWAIAYKFESPEGTTEILEIDIQVGRTGRITPVARVSPVLIGGSTISNVTLHNQEYINLLELAIGDTVTVSKRGDVIPAVERVVEKNSSGNSLWKLPEFCPSCSAELVLRGAHHFCPDPDCPDQVRGRIFFFIGRDQMDIDGFGPETAEFLIKEGFIGDIADIYSFDYSLLEGYPGFGPKKIALISEGVKKSLNQPYKRVLPSLGIPEIGRKVAELLIDAGYRNVEDLISIAKSGDSESLTAIKGIGDRTAEIIIDQFSSGSLLSMVEKLRKAGLKFYQEESTGSNNLPGIFEGQVWCITGSFENFRPRSIAGEEIEKRGGRTVTAVTGKTTHLLAGESAGSKLDKARNLGIEIITEEIFMEMIE